jgi:hypothetical protein
VFDSISSGHFDYSGQKRPFVPVRSASRWNKRLDVTKTPGKIFAVVTGFCHSEP